MGKFFFANHPRRHEAYGSSFFANGARPGGVLKHPGVLKDPSKLRESWQAVYGGTANTGKVVVLEEGVDYQQISIPPEEAQFLETRKFQIDEIARLYRVPPHMLHCHTVDMTIADMVGMELGWKAGV